MILAIFENYCIELNKKIIEEKRNILMILENFLSYVGDNFWNFKFLLLQPNTTTVLKLLDQGVISILKPKYWNKVLSFLISTFYDTQQNADMALKNGNFLIVFNWLEQIINELSKVWIINCWRKLQLKKKEPTIIEKNSQSDTNSSSFKIKFK